MQMMDESEKAGEGRCNGCAGLAAKSRNCCLLPDYNKKIYLCYSCYRIIHINRLLTSGATSTC